MSEENVETIRRAYAAYNAAFSAPNPQAIRATLERFADPEIEFEMDPIVSIDRERFIDCGDRVMAFTRIEARGRSSGPPPAQRTLSRRSRS